MDNMKEYVVLYRIESIMTEDDCPFGFICWAEDKNHAEEQCINSEPDGDIVYVFQGNSYPGAVKECYGGIFDDIIDNHFTLE